MAIAKKERVWVEWINTKKASVEFAGLLQEIKDSRLAVDVLMQQAGSPSPLLRSLAHTLDEFALFSQNVYEHIKNDADASPNDLFQVLGKIRRELRALLPLVAQRSASASQQSSQQQRFQEYLSVADAVVNDCLEHCLTCLGAEVAPPCLTVFEDTTLVRMGRCSYERVTSIALPITYKSEPWRWLAIGHEIGHYIYWNYSVKSKASINWLRDNQTGLEGDTFKEILESALLREVETPQETKSPIQRSFISSEEFLRPLLVWHEWLEELFADVIGVMLFGPAYVYSTLLVLRAQLSRANLTKNDHVHPVIILRPLLQAEVLRKLEEANGVPADDRAEQIDATWRQLCDSVLANDGGGPVINSNQLLQQQFESLSLADHLELGKKVVGLVLDKITPKKSDPLYSLQDHAAVLDAADQLAVARLPAAPLAPRLCIAAAFYAWHDVTAWTLSAEVPGLEEESTLAKIRDWLKTSTGPQPAVRALLPPKEDPLQRRLGVSFTWLLAALKTAYPNAPAEIRNYLLAMEFSVDESYTCSGARAYISDNC